MLTESVAVMQPYFFPNLSYYKLVRNVEVFVFYNDVHFIKGGWINKNNILNNGTSIPFRMPVKDISQNKLINTVEIFNKESEVLLLLKKIHFSYAKAPYYKEVFPIIEEVLHTNTTLIADMAELSVRAVFNYLNLSLEALRSSELMFNRAFDDKTDRMISLIKHLNKCVYLNAVGGKSLYSKEYFQQHNIDLFFVQPEFPAYKQFNNAFIPSLSIIDVLMFNSRAEVVAMLDSFNYD